MKYKALRSTKMSQLTSLGQHSQIVREYISKNLPHVSSKQQLLDEILSLKENKWVPKYMSPEETVKNILSEKIIEKSLLKGKTNHIERFATGEYTTIELAITLLNRSWFSHYSAFEIHRLVENNLSKIYITQEQSPKVFQNMDLVHDVVEKVFEKEQRPLTQISKFKNKEYCLLKGKYSNRLGVMHLNYNNIEISITDVERTLIDCVVRPAYAGDVKTIIEAFQNARGKADIAKMYNYLVN